MSRENTGENTDDDGEQTIQSKPKKRLTDTETTIGTGAKRLKRDTDWKADVWIAGKTPAERGDVLHADTKKKNDTD